LMQKAAQWRLTQDANPQPARRRPIPALVIRVLAVLRLWR
jgi:hypothetical protein